MKPIITLSDGTQVLQTTGDLDAFKYGGGVLYKKDKEIYWQFWDAREPGQKNYYVFTSPIPDDVLRFFKFAEVEIVSKVAFMDKKDVLKLSRSKDPKERALLVSFIKDTYGPSAVDPDQSSETLTPWQLSKRWADVFGKKEDGTVQAQLDDYLIKESIRVSQTYECGRINGDFIGRFETYELCLAAICKWMSKNDGFNCNVFHEHEPGKLELIEWDIEDYKNIKIKVKNKVLPSVFWKNSMKIYINDDMIQKRILARSKKEKSVRKLQKQSQARINRENRIERAREFKKTMGDIWS